jgi:hypothetical protein
MAAISSTLNGFLQIKNLETRAQDVRSLIPSLRNMLQPINRLPPKILLRIPQCFLHMGVAVDTRPIVPLTHVCRYWRDSISSDPANWVLISNLSEGLTALTLERTANAVPLQVYLVTRDDPASRCVPVPYIQNMDTLQVVGEATVEKLRQALPGYLLSTPNLRSLKVTSGRTIWGQSVDPFESLTLGLRCLALSDIPLYPSTLRLRSLTEFNQKTIGSTSTWNPFGFFGGESLA